MSTDMLLYVIYGVGGIFAIIVISYFILSRKMQKSDYRQIKKLRQGTERNSFSTDKDNYRDLYLIREWRK